MQDSPPARRRWPPQPSGPATNNPFHRFSSIANLQEASAHIRAQPAPSPTYSSSSSDDGHGISRKIAALSIIREMQRRKAGRSESPDESSFEFSSDYEQSSSPPMSPGNPWRRGAPDRNNHARLSPVGGSASPESASRSTTPIAPQPLRPFIADPSLIPARDKIVYPPPFAPDHVVSASMPNLYDDEGESFTLEVQFITSELQQEQSKYVPALMRQLGWPKSTKKLVYHWFINNPKTALLLWMADDVRAWPPANLHGLNDQMLPYSINDLEGIAADPPYVAELQWKVAHKPLPRDRKHTEFVVKETVPLATVRTFSTEAWTLKSKRLDFVKFCDGTTPLVYFRKRLDLRDYADKQAILSQIHEYHRLSHPAIAEIVGSYARGQTIAFLTPRADSSLDEYLETFAGTSEAELLLSWMRALASALCYLHELRPAVTHRSLRPQKILVYHSPSGAHGGAGGSGGNSSNGIGGGNGSGSGSGGGGGGGHNSSSVRLAVFGIARPARSTAAQLFQPYSTDAAYVYAAPETVARRGGSAHEGSAAAAAADVFALGAVFLEMACAARGVPVGRLADARQAASHDPSYHANLDRVDDWFALLASPPPPPPPPGADPQQLAPLPQPMSRRERRAAAIGRVLPVIRSMLAPEPEARPDMKFVLSYFEQGSPRARPMRRTGLNVGRELLRERMAMGSNVWGELETLNGYYDQPQASSSSSRYGGESQGEGRGSWRW